MKLVSRIFEAVRTTFEFLVIMCFVFMLIKTFVEPIAPAITALTVLAFTVYTMKKTVAGALSIAGIALYAISWWAFLNQVWGPFHASLVCSAGILAWFLAIAVAFSAPKSWLHAMART